LKSRLFVKGIQKEDIDAGRDSFMRFSNRFLTTKKNFDQLAK